MPKAASNAEGYLLLYKKSGLTSFDSLHQVKKALRTGKVGHTGTLDKFAEGLLVLVAGTYTSLVPIFNELDKVYIGTIRFGIETDTLDPEGTVISTAPVPTKEVILQVLPRFVGSHIQIPPAYSAIHIDGQRASERIRSGQAVEMKGREITIYSIEVLNVIESRVTIKIHCSKGTYIRALARDIGKAAGSCAYLESLKRVAVGPFDSKDAISPDSGEQGMDAIQGALKPVSPELFYQLKIPVLHLDVSDTPYILQGRPLSPILTKYGVRNDSELMGIFAENNRLLALIGPGGKYRHVYPH